MKRGDMRDVCLALIAQIRGSGEPGRASQPAALGWQLEHQNVSIEQLSSWCAALLRDRGANAPRAALQRRWLSSPPLRALLAEYRLVVANAERTGVSPAAVSAQCGRNARRADRQRAQPRCQ